MVLCKEMRFVDSKKHILIIRDLDFEKSIQVINSYNMTGPFVKK